MTLSVHVGLHKTGSTSLQAGLGTAAGHIGRRQVYLPWTDLFLTDGVINEAGTRRIRRLGARGWHAVVSSEGALGPMSMSTVYPDAAPVARQLDELFGEQGLRVIVYLRPQHEWAESAYAQYVRGGGTSHPRDFVTALREQPYLHYAALVDDMRESLRSGQLIVRPYRAAMDVVSDFFDTARLGPVPSYLGEQRANVSLSPEEVDALRRANDADDTAVRSPADDTESDSPLRGSVLPEDCQVDLHALFVTDWTELGGLVAAMPGHDPAEFRDLVDASRDWAPRPFVEASPHGRGVARRARPLSGSTGHARTASSVMMDRRQRWEFLLRHGPRRMLLKTLMRAG